MHIAMTEPEIKLLSAFLRKTSNYLEFGTGGSTVLANRLVAQRITSVDSSREWIAAVETACKQVEGTAAFDLVFTDIGPIGEWGFPKDPSTSSRWPAYYEQVWQLPQTFDTDFCLVDGRFRVACFLTILLRCKSDTLIGIHDFAGRPHYHVCREYAREVAVVEKLSIFIPNPTVSRQRIAEELERHRLDPR